MSSCSRDNIDVQAPGLYKHVFVSTVKMFGVKEFGLLLGFLFSVAHGQSLPIFVSTWEQGENCSRIAYDLYNAGYSLLDSVENGISLACELNFCADSVGPYGKVNEDGYITQDAMLMDGTSMVVGSVAALYNIRPAISVARAVMDHSTHTLLVGRDATRFAVDMGFTEEDIQTEETNATWEDWKAGNCQPNYRKNVTPAARFNCGPYSPATERHDVTRTAAALGDHDTVNTLGVSEDGLHVVAGTTTNGLSFKVPGRVGDSPIAGAGSYADSEVGGAAATGNGDILLRFLPSYQTVENMRQGMSPTAAAQDAILRIKKHYPDFEGALIAVNTTGHYGSACNGYGTFPYAVMSADLDDVVLLTVECEA